MIKNRKELDSFIQTVFCGCDVFINGIFAATNDLTKLCEDVGAGKTNIKITYRKFLDGKIKLFCVDTVNAK